MKLTAIHRIGTAALPVLFAALLSTDANAALRRTEIPVVSRERSTVADMRDFKTDFDLPEGDSSAITHEGTAGIRGGSAVVKGTGGKTMESIEESPGEIGDFDIQTEVDTDIRAKLKAEMDKLEPDPDRNSANPIESATGSNGRPYLGD
jgi:hypothetical protein